MKMRHNQTVLAVISTPFGVMANSMTRTVPYPTADIPSPDPMQGAQTQLTQEKQFPSIWGSPQKMWAIWGWRVLFLCAACVVAWQSLQPATMEEGIQHLDKVLHLLSYGVLMVLGLLSRLKVNAVWVAFIVILIGVILEVLQGTMNLGRTASLADAIANSVGVGLVYVIWRWLKR
jgi:VanZ family protein